VAARHLFSLGEVIEATGGRVLNLAPGCTDPADLQVFTVTYDSRMPQAGSLFVALPGESFDGHDFLDEAAEAGAVAALVSRNARGIAASELCLVQVDNTQTALGDLGAYYRRRYSPLVVGVTGSLGKTTTKDMIYAALTTSLNVMKNHGNLNTEIGLPVSIFDLKREHEAAVLEMGMRGPGEIARLCEIAQPKIGVLTNIAESHIEVLGTIGKIAAAKAELLASLPPDGVAILNGDDPRVRQVSSRADCRRVFYSIESDGDVEARNLDSLGARGVSFLVSAGGNTAAIELPVPGRHNVSNALAAIAVALEAGISLERAAAGLEGLQLTGMRMEVTRWQGATLLNDAYNASPTSTRAALETAVDIKAAQGGNDGRFIVCLGDMLELGHLAIEGHRQVGSRAWALGVSEMVLVGPLARHFGAGALEAGMPASAIHQAEDNQQAAALLREIVDEGDVVLIKASRGMRFEEIAGTLTKARVNDKT